MLKLDVEVVRGEKVIYVVLAAEKLTKCRARYK